MKTNAVIFRSPSVAEVGPIEMPPPVEDQIQVHTKLSTISAGTEGWTFRNEFTWSPTPYPCVPGYQLVGTVTAVGPGVRGWKIGDRAMAVGGDWVGPVNAFWGGHVADVTVPVARAFKISDTITDIDASAGVVAEVGYNAASRPKLRRNDWVVVFGDGIIGQCAAQAARARGARVILVGHRPERLALGKKHSAAAVVNSGQDDVVKAVRKITKRPTVTAVLDSVQRVDAQKQYLDLLEPIRGQIVYCGFTRGTVWADMGLLQQRELTAYFIAGWTRPRMAATFALMAAGKMKIRPLITHRVPYTEAPRMYAMINEKSEPFLGITFEW